MNQLMNKKNLITVEYVAYSGQFFVIEWYYDSNCKSDVFEYFKNLDEGQQRKAMMLFKRMGDFGKILDKTKFRNESDKIYAFKPQPDRFLSFFCIGKKIILTNAFCKKTDKLPKEEKEKAENRMNDYLKRTQEGTYYDNLRTNDAK